LSTQNEALLKSNELLYQSEKRLTQAEKVARIGNWTLQLNTKTMIASIGADEIYGVDFQKIALAEVQRIALPEYRVNMDKALVDLLEKNITYDVEFKICRPNDKKIVDIHSVARFDKETNTVFGVIQDITEKKLAEQKMREREEGMQLLLNSTAEAIYGIDLDGKCTFCNNACLQLFGFNSKDELLGKDMHWLVHGKHADGSVYAIEECPISQAIKNGKGIHIDDEVLWYSNGSSFHAEYWSVPQYKDGKIIGAVVSSLDITSRKKIEEALQLSEQRYRLLAESTSDVTWVLNLTSKKFTYMSPAIYTLRGLTIQEAMNESLETAMTQESLQRVNVILERNIQFLKNNPEVLFGQLTEIQQPCKNGKLIWVELSTRYRYGINGEIEVVGVSRNIEERKDIEKKLIESEERFKKLSSFTFEGIVIHNNGIAIDANESMIRLLGFERSEIIGMNLFNIIRPDYHEIVRENIVKQVATPYRIIVKRKNGSTFDAEIEGKNISYNGDYFRVACIRDITERMKTEEKMKSLLAEKEIILKEVHHRIKNNMNTVSSLLSLQAGTITDPTAIMALEEAGNRIRSMSVLYDKLYRSAEFNELSVKGYLSSMVDEILANFPNSQIVRNEKYFQDFKLDSKRLQSLGIIINELLTNSMKYAFINRKTGLIKVLATNVGGHVAICVQDDGTGMPESISFVDTTGFGLQLVKVLTQQLNGTIRVERDNGTNVVLEFEV